jgi:hypothetical protein
MFVFDSVRGLIRQAKMVRTEVFKKINHERLYQQGGRWPLEAGFVEGGICRTSLSASESTTEERYHEIGGWISFMETYLEEARDINSKSDDTQAALLKIRAVAAMAVACLEQHGCPDRPEPKERLITPELREFLKKMIPPCDDKDCPIHRS